MRKILSVELLLMTAFALTAVARADVISPAGMVVYLAYRVWPVLLVAVLVVVTMLLLKKFKKK